MNLILRTRVTKRHGIAWDLDVRIGGRRYRPTIGYNLTREEAERRAVAMVERIQRQLAGVRDPAGKPASGSVTLEAVAPLFWKAFALKGRVDRVRPEGIMHNHLFPFFAGRSLDTLRAEDGLNYMLHRQRQGASPGTIRREMQVLRRLLHLAVRFEYLAKDPLAGIEMPEPARRTRVATFEELRAIRDAPGLLVEELWRIILVALMTGLRQARILAMRTSWLEARADGYWLCCPPGPSKLKGTPAELPLNRVAAAAILDEMTVQALLRGSPPPDQLIFRRWVNVRAFKRYWAVVTQRAGVSDLHFHDLRHTFATWLQRAGISYEVRQHLLGHKIPGMTATYSHGGPEWLATLRHAVEQLVPLVDDLVYERPTDWVAKYNLLNCGEPPGTRTQGPRLKRAMLYRLS